MAEFTVVIEEAIDPLLGVALVSGCGATSGVNTGIFYITPTIVDGTELYTDEELTNIFIGDPSELYLGTGSDQNGTVNLQTIPITNFTFNVSALGIVSNITTCT